MKSSEELCKELLSIAEAQRKEIEKILPKDPMSCCALYVEALRVLDYQSFSSKLSDEKEAEKKQNLDIMKMGLNLATFYLLKPIEQFGFPLLESTFETRQHAIGLLFNLGFTVLIKRAVEMVKANLQTIDKKDNVYIFRSTDISSSQHLDSLEHLYLEKIEDKVAESKGYYNGWNITAESDILNVFFKSGNFFAKRSNKKLEDFIIVDVDSIMLPLIQPWDSGRGIIMSYDGGKEDLDFHFVAKAIEIVSIWRDEAGLHPDTKIGKINAGDLSYIVIVIVSLYLKHLHFSHLAFNRFPEISVPQSLMAWSIADDLKNNISEATGMEKELVSQIFDAISLKPEDAVFLEHYSTQFIPLIIDLGNGFILRPLSSINVNPFYTIITLLEYRDPSIKNKISQPREAWLREHLYHIYGGTRYQRIEGNINLRIGNKTVTDIDAAICDILTGELAIFQLKWQDFFFNDVKKLRSRAKNLTEELDEWAIGVTDWISSQGLGKLINCLRIKPTSGIGISSVYLFGISKNAARMQGYGYNLKSENLAIATWPQLIRNRQEIGPAQRVFKTLFEELKKQQTDKISSRPLSYSFEILDTTIKFEDLWKAYDE